MGTVVEDYFEYERRLAGELLLPCLVAQGVDPEGAAVLDIGCGHGGVLAELVQRRRLRAAVGIDMDGEMIAQARARGPGVDFREQDFFAYNTEERFDLILLRDVLEHIGDYQGALAKARTLLRAGGRIFVSYAPFYSPFGGHQHNGSGPFARIPWLQFLPAPLFKPLLGLRGNSYKSRPELSRDIDSVLATRLTLSRFDRAARVAGLKTVFRRQYLVRPDYRIKFGLRPRLLPPLPAPFRELLCTAEETLLAGEP